MHSSTRVENRKAYEAPILRKLASEQATLFLVGHAYIGHRGARELLQLLFWEPTTGPGCVESENRIQQPVPRV